MATDLTKSVKFGTPSQHRTAEIFTTFFTKGPVNQLKIFSQIAKQLDALRKRSLVFGDLKPANLMFTDESAQQVKLVDFGSICETDERLYLRTELYTSAEVQDHGQAIPTQDIESLGLTMVEIVTDTDLVDLKRQWGHEILVNNPPNNFQVLWDNLDGKNLEPNKKFPKLIYTDKRVAREAALRGLSKFAETHDWIKNGGADSFTVSLIN